MRKITSLLSLLFLLWGQSVFAQQTVSGNVKDNSTNQPIPKVTVSVEGTSVATTTDNNGDFSVQVPAGKKFLIFSMNCKKFLKNGAKVTKGQPLSHDLSLRI